MYLVLVGRSRPPSGRSTAVAAAVVGTKGVGVGTGAPFNSGGELVAHLEDARSRDARVEPATSSSRQRNLAATLALAFVECDGGSSSQPPELSHRLEELKRHPYLYAS